MLHKSLLAFICMLLFGLAVWMCALKPASGFSVEQAPVAVQATLGLPPLPGGHGGASGEDIIPGRPGDKQFVSGYVTVDGVPVTGAEVTIYGGDFYTSVQTMIQTAFLPTDTLPFFYATLDDPRVHPGDLMTITAVYNGQTNRINFQVSPDGQERTIASGEFYPLQDAVQIAAGTESSNGTAISHTCISTTSGQVKCWGSNQRGQLGDGTTIDSSLPLAVQGLPGNADAITAGALHTCALVNDGVWCWGDNYYLALGNSEFGQPFSKQPIAVMGLSSGINAISAGSYSTCALTSGGGVLCWGADKTGPVHVDPQGVATLGSGVSAIVNGYAHACALMTTGDVKCWGDNSDGQLGDGTLEAKTVPVNVNGLRTTASALTVGSADTCVLTKDGGVKCWGDNDYAQLGRGYISDRGDPDYVQGLSAEVKEIAAGYRHSCVITIVNGVKCWGDNGSGQLGDGTHIARTTPVDVFGLTSGVAHIVVARNYSCAVLLNSEVKCWGGNESGQLGDGTTSYTTIPVSVVEPGAAPPTATNTNTPTITPTPPNTPTNTPTPTVTPMMTPTLTLTPPSPVSATWTLLIYAVGDNDLYPYLGETSDGMIARLRKAAPQPNVQVSILYDGLNISDTKQYTLTAYGGWSEAKRGELPMDQENTLQEFLANGFKRLPATYYYLAIVDHANGVIGIALDQASANQFLEPAEVHEAIAQAEQASGRKLNILHFDGCSFGLFEDTSIGEGLTDYIIASSNTAWGIFAYEKYRELAGQRDTGPLKLAENVANFYANVLENKKYPYTIAVYDLAHYRAVQTALDQLGNALANYIKTGDSRLRKAELQSIRNRNLVQKYDFDDYRITEIDPYLDVRDLAIELAVVTDPSISVAATEVLTATGYGNGFIAYEKHASGTFYDLKKGELTSVTLTYASGLGIYYPDSLASVGGGACDPQKPQGAYCKYTSHMLFPNLTKDWGWTNFLLNGLSEAETHASAQPLEEKLLAPLIAPNQVFLPIIIR